MKAPIRWHAEARQLRNEGRTPAQIAEALNRSRSIVHEVLAASRAAPRDGKADARRPACDT